MNFLSTSFETGRLVLTSTDTTVLAPCLYVTSVLSDLPQGRRGINLHVLPL